MGSERRELELSPESGTRVFLEFPDPGLARLYCELHDDEHLSVFVAPSRLYDVLDGAGRFEIAGVPPGPWRLHVWSEVGEGPMREVEVSAFAVAREPIQLDTRHLVRR